jgi:hypothetical protein
MGSRNSRRHKYKIGGQALATNEEAKDIGVRI